VAERCRPCQEYRGARAQGRAASATQGPPPSTAMGVLTPGAAGPGGLGEVALLGGTQDLQTK